MSLSAERNAVPLASGKAASRQSFEDIDVTELRMILAHMTIGLEQFHAVGEGARTQRKRCLSHIFVQVVGR